ncbi:MAG: hypothetical protein M1119_12635 [Firmicutes bacterium]|nr:hypothetical protein [Bacillota bacterium]
MLGVAVIGVANAATIRYAGTNPTPVQVSQAQSTAQTQVQVQPTATQDAVQQMIQACWQMNQAMVDQWVKTTGLSREELLKMEQAWMQGVMQQNPNFDTQAAYNMHQSWMQNYVNSYQPVSQQAPAPQNSTPGQNNSQYNSYGSQYGGWNCPPGWGNNGYGCW